MVFVGLIPFVVVVVCDLAMTRTVKQCDMASWSTSCSTNGIHQNRLAQDCTAEPFFEISTFVFLAHMAAMKAVKATSVMKAMKSMKVTKLKAMKGLKAMKAMNAAKAVPKISAWVVKAAAKHKPKKSRTVKATIAS